MISREIFICFGSVLRCNMHVKLFETALFHEHILIKRLHYHLKQTCENKMLLKRRLNIGP